MKETRQSTDLEKLAFR